MSAGGDEGTNDLRATLIRITTLAASVPPHERIGFYKGAAMTEPNLSQPDRSALFAALVSLGEAAQPPQSPVIVHNNVSQNQNANPVIAQTASPSQVVGSGPASESDTRKTPLRKDLILGLLTLLGLIGAAIVTARYSLKPGDRSSMADTVSHRKPETPRSASQAKEK
jgi:hypothetical protein